MRIYEGSPREDFEEVFRSIGAFLDQRGMKEVLLAEAPDGFIVQGLVTTVAAADSRTEPGQVAKETLTFLDDDIARFMEEALIRRGRGESTASGGEAGYYESAFRVLGRYMDEHRTVHGSGSCRITDNHDLDRNQCCELIGRSFDDHDDIPDWLYPRHAIFQRRLCRFIW